MASHSGGGVTVIEVAVPVAVREERHVGALIALPEAGVAGQTDRGVVRQQLHQALT
ncbi:MAG: hypothetical protein HYX52_00280 [Chloroflexi bacterium]|nr:hypothetical protein [Chloroflexota bacterium]